MDTRKIGLFIASLRKEKQLTQEQLGERLGVSNKTISRWETGSYLPPVEMLQLLSREFSVSFNELLAGERLTADTFQAKSEETLQSVLRESSFSTAERYAYWKAKWRREHRFIRIVLPVLELALYLFSLLQHRPLLQAAVLLIGLGTAVYLRNRMFGYIEGHTFSDNEK